MHIKYRITAEVLRERCGLTRGLPIDLMTFGSQISRVSHDFRRFLDFKGHSPAGREWNKIPGCVGTVVTRVTRRVPLMEQELIILLDQGSSPPILVGFVLLDLLLCRIL